MTVTDGAASAEAGTLALDFDLPHAPEKVWRALTDPALVTEWLLPVVGFRPEPGTAFTFRTQASPGWDGIVECEVIEAEAHRLLSYRWQVLPLDTVLTFTLTPTETGTRLGIVQSGFTREQRREFGGARYGWQMMGGRLVDLLARIP